MTSSSATKIVILDNSKAAYSPCTLCIGQQRLRERSDNYGVIACICDVREESAHDESAITPTLLASVVRVDCCFVGLPKNNLNGNGSVYVIQHVESPLIERAEKQTIMAQRNTRASATIVVSIPKRLLCPMYGQCRL